MEVVVLGPVDAGPLEPFFLGKGEVGGRVVVSDLGVGPEFAGLTGQAVETVVALLEHVC